jgi:hypothetical protein
MQIQPEAPAVPTGEQAARSVAFGLLLEVDPNLEIPGIPPLQLTGAGEGEDPGPERPSAPPYSRPPTRVRLDPNELARRWSAAAHASERVRELRNGETLLLSVELAPFAGYLVHAPGFGRILVAPDGTELLCDPEPGSSEWSTLLPAQALPLAATLQGLEVLHASGVVLRDRASLLAGPSGAGKSSLAAALLRRGAALLSDDTAVLESRDGTLIAHPGAALLQLGAAEHERLSAPERAVLGPPEAFLDKQRYNPGTIASATPFGELFLLERAMHGPPLERIEAVDPFTLLASTFNLSVRTPERLARHLDLAVALAATERIYRLRIQPDVDATQLAEIVHEQLAAAS